MAACTLLAHADAKVVSKMTMTMAMAGQTPQNQTMTTYYKGAMMRAESSEGQTFIMDGKAKKTYLLDAATQTYSEVSLDSMAGPAKDMMKKMKVKMSAHLKPTKQHMKIAGKKADKYIVDMIMSMNMPGMGGQASPGTMDMTMHMEQWTTMGLKTPYTPSQTMGAMSQMLKGLSMLGDTHQLVKEMSKMRGLPLNNTMTMVMTMKPGKGAPTHPAGSPMTFNMNMKTVVQSITEGPLSDTLFKIPAGYKKSTKPMMPGRRRMGG